MKYADKLFARSLLEATIAFGLISIVVGIDVLKFNEVDTGISPVVEGTAVTCITLAALCAGLISRIDNHYAGVHRAQGT